MQRIRISLAAALLIAAAPALALAGPIGADDVTPDVIFGSGNANGSFTIDLNNNVELGLRGKLRHDATGQPQNIFNWDGDHTYTFNPGVAPTQSFPTAEWNFEWSINTDQSGTSGVDLDDLDYSLSMTSSTGAFTPAFDPIHDINPVEGSVFWDHAIGTNSTANGGGTSASDATTYAALITANNVAQNSWKPHWFAASFDPNLTGWYDYTLSAMDQSGAQIASTTIRVQVGAPAAVPVPAAVWLALPLFGGLGLVRRRRRRRLERSL